MANYTTYAIAIAKTTKYTVEFVRVVHFLNTVIST